jgi:hypothetical protein
VIGVFIFCCGVFILVFGLIKGLFNLIFSAENKSSQSSLPSRPFPTSEKIRRKSFTMDIEDTEFEETKKAGYHPGLLQPPK